MQLQLTQLYVRKYFLIFLSFVVSCYEPNDYLICGILCAIIGVLFHSTHALFPLFLDIRKLWVGDWNKIKRSTEIYIQQSWWSSTGIWEPLVILCWRDSLNFWSCSWWGTNPYDCNHVLCLDVDPGLEDLLLSCDFDVELYLNGFSPLWLFCLVKYTISSNFHGNKKNVNELIILK